MRKIYILYTYRWIPEDSNPEPEEIKVVFFFGFGGWLFYAPNAVCIWGI